MIRDGRRRLLRATGGALVFGLAGCMDDTDATPSPGGGTTPAGGPETTAVTTTDSTPTSTPRPLTDPKQCGGSGGGENGVRLINLVPDADAISIDADGSELFVDVPYTGACGRKNLGSSPRITVSAGGSTVFDDTVSIPGNGPRTLAIAGEAAPDGTPITPIAFEEFDQSFIPGNASVFQVVHGSPDGPRLTVTSGGAVNVEVEDGISFGETALPGPQEYFQAADRLFLNDAESGDTIATFSGSFAPGAVFTLCVIGYWVPESAPGNAPLGVLVTSRSAG